MEIHVLSLQSLLDSSQYVPRSSRVLEMQKSLLGSAAGAEVEIIPPFVFPLISITKRSGLPCQPVWGQDGRSPSFSLDNDFSTVLFVV